MIAELPLILFFRLLQKIPISIFHRRDSKNEFVVSVCFVAFCIAPLHFSIEQKEGDVVEGVVEGIRCGDDLGDRYSDAHYHRRY